MCTQSFQVLQIMFCIMQRHIFTLLSLIICELEYYFFHSVLIVNYLIPQCDFLNFQGVILFGRY